MRENRRFRRSLPMPAQIALERALSQFQSAVTERAKDVGDAHAFGELLLDSGEDFAHTRGLGFGFHGQHGLD